MRSMTGFGAATAPLGKGALRLELRALNHRHQEVRLKLPTEIAEQAFYVEQLARAELGRGRYDIHIRAEGRPFGDSQLSLERAKQTLRVLEKLRDEVAPGADIPFDALLRMPDLFETVELATEEVQLALSQAFRVARASLEEMRKLEGDAIALELRGRLGRLREIKEALAGASSDIIAHFRERLTERVKRVLESSSTSLNPERLEHEVVLLAERSDVTEEMVRLESHFAQLEALFNDAEPVGRKLDFLLQEIGREVNTIGSKSQSAPLAHLIVEMKAEVEKIREQIQNVD